MLDAIKNIFEGKEKTSESKSDSRLAVSALMIEAAMMDGELTDDEKSTILQLLCNYFDLTDDESKTLFKEASNLQSSSSQLIHFTRTIKDGYSEEDRVALMEMMWKVVQADGIEDNFETNLMRRIAGLLYVSDRDSGLARKRARNKLQDY